MLLHHEIEIKSSLSVNLVKPPRYDSVRHWMSPGFQLQTSAGAIDHLYFIGIKKQEENVIMLPSAL